MQTPNETVTASSYGQEVDGAVVGRDGPNGRRPGRMATTYSTVQDNTKIEHEEDDCPSNS